MTVGLADYEKFSTGLQNAANVMSRNTFFAVKKCPYPLRHDLISLHLSS